MLTIGRDSFQQSGVVLDNSAINHTEDLVRSLFVAGAPDHISQEWIFVKKEMIGKVYYITIVNLESLVNRSFHSLLHSLFLKLKL
jgi:hypothetical protein